MAKPEQREGLLSKLEEKALPPGAGFGIMAGTCNALQAVPAMKEDGTPSFAADGTVAEKDLRMTDTHIHIAKKLLSSMYEGTASEELELQLASDIAIYFRSLLANLYDQQTYLIGSYNEEGAENWERETEGMTHAQGQPFSSWSSEILLAVFEANHPEVLERTSYKAKANELRGKWQKRFKALGKDNIWGHFYMWHFERSGYPRALTLIARLLLEEVILPAREEKGKRQERPIPSLYHPVMEGVSNILRTGAVMQNDNLELVNDGMVVARAPSTRPTLLDGVLRSNLKDLQSLHGIRLLIWLIRHVHHNYQAHTYDPRAVEVDGGFMELRELLGATSNKASAKLRAALDAGSQWEPNSNLGFRGRGLWTWLDSPPAPGRTAKLEIVVSSILTPNNPMPSKGERLLTPVCELAPLVGRRNGYASVALFQLELVHALSKGSRQLPEHGGVLLEESDLLKLAARAGLPKTTMHRALDRWIQDGDDAPAFLEAVDRDRYHLARNDLHGEERLFLDEQGQKREKNAKRGKASSRKRRGKKM